MAIYQYNILLIPKSAAIDKASFTFDEEFDFWEYDWWQQSLTFDALEAILIENLPVIEWSKECTDLHQFGNDKTNDISISLVDEKFIENIHVRIDLSRIDHKFIDLVLKIAARNDCLLLDRQGKIFVANFQKIKDSIQTSNAFKFVSNPTGFLSELGLGEIKPEKNH